jgi:hypothetical protein
MSKRIRKCGFFSSVDPENLLGAFAGGELAI